MSIEDEGVFGDSIVVRYIGGPLDGAEIVVDPNDRIITRAFTNGHYVWRDGCFQWENESA